MYLAGKRMNWQTLGDPLLDASLDVPDACKSCIDQHFARHRTPWPLPAAQVDLLSALKAFSQNVFYELLSIDRVPISVVWIG